MILAALLYLSLFALAARMQRHGPALLGPWHRPALLLYLPIAGWLLLALSLLAALMAPEWPRALVTWFGLLPFAAGLVLLGITYSTRAARAAVPGAVALLLASLIF